MEHRRDDKLQELFRTHARTRRSVLAGALLTAGVASTGCLSFMDAAWAQVGDQPDWRFCNKCNTMFFDGYPTNKGRCPAGGTHFAQGFRFLMHFDARKGDGGRRQYDWRFCGKCSAMFFDGYPNKGRCPAGGAHNAAGWMFGLVHQSPTGWQQNHWRFCNKCQALFYDGYPSKGACAAGGGHAAQGYMFFVNYEEPKQQPGPAAGTLGQRIVKYAQSHLGHCIDSTGKDHAAACAAPQGECTHLVQAALAFVHARPPNFGVTPYVWGTRLTSGPPQIGDILQFTNAKLQGSNGFWETTTQHTAIIETVNANNVLGVLEQNANNQRRVTRGTVNLGWNLVRGRIDRYRAIAA